MSLIMSTITFVLVTVFFAGKVWRVSQSQKTPRAHYVFMPESESDKVGFVVDLSNGDGDVFSVCSEDGMKSITVHKTLFDNGSSKKARISYVMEGIDPKEEIRFRVKSSEDGNACLVKILKNDYTKVSFKVTKSDGVLVQSECKVKMTWKSWLFYVCG